jgi:L-fuconolactonase
MKATGVTGTVLVEQARTLEESLWLAKMAEADDLIRGIVGWVPLTDPDVDRHLALLKWWSKVKGVRHAIQDESDDQFILREDFGRGISRCWNLVSLITS